MSTNLRKAQKHMQRARELLNQGQLGFGVPRKSKVGEERKQEENNFSMQTDNNCYMYAAFNIVLKMLSNDSNLQSLSCVLKAREIMRSGGSLGQGTDLLDEQTSRFYASLREYEFRISIWEYCTRDREKEVQDSLVDECKGLLGMEWRKKPELKQETDFTRHGGSGVKILQAMILQSHCKIAFMWEAWDGNTHFLSTVQRTNKALRVKDQHVETNYKQTVKQISENKSYENTYIFCEMETTKCKDYTECLSKLDMLQPLRHRLAGAFIGLQLKDDDAHVVAVIPHKGTFYIYDSNLEYQLEIDICLYKIREKLDYFTHITFVFAPTQVIIERAPSKDETRQAANRTIEKKTKFRDREFYQFCELR